MKEFPEDLDAYLDILDVLRPVRESLEFAFDVERKNENQDVPYDGYEHGNLVGTPGVQELLTVEHQEYRAERGWDLMDTLLHVALLLGAEMGRREVHSKIDQIKHEQDMDVRHTLMDYERQVKGLLERLSEALGYDDPDTMLEEEDDDLKELMGLIDRGPVEISQEIKDELKAMWKALDEDES